MFVEFSDWLCYFKLGNVVPELFSEDF
jgi:hypothetical protein